MKAIFLRLCLKKLFMAFRSQAIKLLRIVCWLVSEPLKWSHPDFSRAVKVVVLDVDWLGEDTEMTHSPLKKE